MKGTTFTLGMPVIIIYLLFWAERKDILLRSQTDEWVETVITLSFLLAFESHMIFCRNFPKSLPHY